MELTDQQGWSRLHGAIVGGADSREFIADLLHERHILAEIQWFRVPERHVSMVLAERHGRIGTLTWDGDTPGELTEGPLIEDLVDELAGILQAEVRIGSFIADNLPEHALSAAHAEEADDHGAEGASEGDASPSAEDGVSIDADPNNDTADVTAGAGGTSCDTSDAASVSETSTRPDQEDVFPASVRMVEISSTPASSFPLFAAIQGAPLGSVELSGNQRALYAHATSGRKGWGFGELPTVTLVMDHDGVTILLVTDDHVENMSAFDWTMHRRLIAGSRLDVSAGHLPENLADLVTKRQDLLRIARAVHGSSPELFALAALEAQQSNDWQVAVAALGLPSTVIDFLAGGHPLDELEGVTIHPPIKVSAAIGRSVDLALEEASNAHPLWDSYETFVQERPWVVKGSIITEAVVGAGLVTYAIASRGPSTMWKKLIGWSGALLVVDAVAEFGIMSYINRRKR